MAPHGRPEMDTAPISAKAGEADARKGRSKSGSERCILRDLLVLSFDNARRQLRGHWNASCPSSRGTLNT